MARLPTRTNSLRIVDSQPRPEELAPITVNVPSNEIAPGVTLDGGAMHIEHGDGSTTIDFSPTPASESGSDEGFYANLVSKLDDSTLADIAERLLDGISRDDESRKEWLSTRARGIQLLGLKLEEPKGEATSGSEGTAVSSVRHPLLLEATIRFQATARGELLPSAGPVKVRNDNPMKTPSQSVASKLPGLAGMGLAGAAPPSPLLPGAANAAPASFGQPPMPGLGPSGPSPGMTPNPTQAASPLATELAVPPMEERDSLAEALETDFNHFLTTVATEYVPDTDRMLFYIGFGGDGFKKIYRCPLRRRPVSESVDAEDLIISNSATDIKNCGRVTHRIKLRKSIVKRMQILGVYADVDLTVPTPPKTDEVEQEKREIEGSNPQTQRPEDRDYEIYESYCELDHESLDQFAPEKLKGEGLPLPYRVTIETTSRKILSIVRNWNEDDEQAMPKQFFVQFPFIRGLGFYGLGFVHVLGNTTSALTAMVREMVDAGMYSNFPGLLGAKVAGRQQTNQIRVPPGGMALVDVPVGGRIQDAVMGMPYKEPGPAFTAFAQWIEQGGQRLGQTADISIGEGKQEAPVGTTLALIEQATKLLDSVHKRLHWAQNEEFGLLKERFREDPEAFWRHNKKPSMKWEKEQFLKALDDYNLVPVADPNNPTSLHRTAKAAVIEGLASKYPQLMNLKAALQRVFRVAGIDSEGLFFEQPLPPPPDPRMAAITQKSQQVKDTMASQERIAQTKAIAQAVVSLKQLEAKAADRDSQQRIEQARIMLEAMKHDAEQRQSQNEAIGAHFDRMSQIEMDRLQAAQEMQVERARTADELRADRARTIQEMQSDAMSRAHEARVERASSAHDLAAERERHQWEMQRAREKHQQEMEHAREKHAADLAQKRALARVQKKSDTKKT